MRRRDGGVHGAFARPFDDYGGAGAVPEQDVPAGGRPVDRRRGVVGGGRGHLRGVAAAGVRQGPPPKLLQAQQLLQLRQAAQHLCKHIYIMHVYIYIYAAINFTHYVICMLFFSLALPFHLFDLLLFLLRFGDVLASFSFDCSFLLRSEN